MIARNKTSPEYASIEDDVDRVLFRPHTLEVILKLSEACNLACSYCYYYFGGDESYKDRPPLLKYDVAEKIANFLCQGAADLNIANVSIVFHGGEPMLMKPAAFDKICRLFRERIENQTTRVRYSIQTNGTLITDAWIEALIEHQVSVSISLDGRKEDNDRYRVDHDDEGSYDAVARGISALKERATEYPFLDPAILSVIQAANSNADAFMHFVNDLGVRRLNLLLPDCSHEAGIPDGVPAEEYGRILCSLFDAWVVQDGIYLREFNSLIARMNMLKHQITPARERNPIVVIQSNGEVTIDDSYIPALAWRTQMPKGHVDTTTLRNWLSQPIHAKVIKAWMTLPNDCQECVWRNVCKGGDLENRYSEDNDLDNPSIYCAGLKIFYAHVIRHLISHGITKDDAIALLGI